MCGTDLLKAWEVPWTVLLVELGKEEVPLKGSNGCRN